MLWVKSQKLIHRHMQYFPNQIIQCHINSSLCRRMKANEMIEIAHNIFDKKRVIAQVVCKGCDARKYCLLVLTVILIRSSFTIADMLVILYLYNNVDEVSCTPREMRNGVVSLRSMGFASICMLHA